MAEKKILVERQVLQYEGVFDLRKFYLEIDQWLREHGYDRYEHKHHEIVTEHGGEVFMELRPWKRFSDYIKGELRLEFEFKHLQDVDVEHDGVKEKLLKGKAAFIMQARMISDYEGHWEATPVYQFMRTFIDKFVRKTQTGAIESEVKRDLYGLADEIKAFLNLYRYRV